MDRTLMLKDDNQSQNSFDSSQICSSVSRTASILSDSRLQTSSELFMTPKFKTKSMDSNFTDQTLSIEKPRIQIHYQVPSPQQEPHFQLGFCKGKNKQNVQINQSKIKKGANFFDDSQTNFGHDFFNSNSMFDFHQPSASMPFNKEISQFSAPGFKNVGKNKKLQIDPNLLQKGKNFFDDDFQETMFPPSSKKIISDNIDSLNFVKPTKVKKTFTTPVAAQDFAKTVNVNKKQKKQISKIEQKPVFDWSKFQISSKKHYEGRDDLKVPSAGKSSRVKNKSSKKVRIESNSFNSLRLQALEDGQKFKQFQEKLTQIEKVTFNHLKKYCNVVKCVLCDLKIQEDTLKRQTLENIFNQKLTLQKLDTIKFTQFYEQVLFKLLKYQTFYSDMINKRFEPSHVLVEIHKKSKVVQSGTPFLGWIDFCMNERKFHHSFVAEVRQVYFSEKKSSYFVLLADGWSNIWAIITQKNYLYKFVHKLKLLSKVFVGYWRFFGISNILEACPKAKKNEKCIEIWYNSTIIVKSNMKLGKPKNIIFYRPLNLIRKEGGAVVPTVEGVVIRMFCPNAPRIKSASNITDQSQNSFTQNFVEILTPEGYSVFIKFVLSSERSLAELFRLYYKYQFYFLKIGQKDSMLTFNDEASKFFEFEKKDKNDYDPALLQILKKRYINSMIAKSLDELCEGKSYDLRIQGKQGVINGRKFIIDNENEPEKSNSFLKAPTLLYQQYELGHIHKDNSFGEEEKIEYFFKRTKFSNTLKTLPAIYEKLLPDSEF